MKNSIPKLRLLCAPLALITVLIFSSNAYAQVPSGSRTFANARVVGFEVSGDVEQVTLEVTKPGTRNEKVRFKLQNRPGNDDEVYGETEDDDAENDDNFDDAEWEQLKLAYVTDTRFRITFRYSDDVKFIRLREREEDKEEEGEEDREYFY